MLETMQIPEINLFSAQREISIAECAGSRHPDLVKVADAYAEAYHVIHKLVQDMYGVPGWEDAESKLAEVVSRSSVTMMHPNHGAAYYPSEHRITVNRLHLNKPQAVLARFVKHELLHAIGLEDESVTDYIAQYINGDDGVRSGYKGLVAQLNEVAGHIPVQELMMEYAADDVETLANLTYRIFVQERVDGFVDGSQLEQILQRALPMINLLFPRLVNRIFAPDRDLHADASVQLSALMNAVKELIMQRNLLQITEKGEVFVQVQSLAMKSGAKSMLEFVNWLQTNGLEYLLYEEMTFTAIQNCFSSAA